MTEKHTPGPWKFRELECDDSRGMGYVSGGPNDVDLFHTGAMELWAFENCANARLIAAAPDMLEALKTVLKYWAWCMPDGPDSTNPIQTVLNTVEAAIAKAEQGESND